MASLRAHSFDTPFTMPLGDDGKVIVDEQLLSLKFGFKVGTMYIEQEIFDDCGEICETVLQLKSRVPDGSFWKSH